jgi:hypothetical protein
VHICLTQDRGVPKVLLDLTVQLGIHNVSVPGAWLKWALRESGAADAKAVAATAGQVDTAYLDSAENDQEEDQFVVYGGEESKDLRGRDAIPRPFDSTSAALTEKVKGTR